MSRLRQVSRSETDDPIVNGMWDLLFGSGVDPVADQKVGTATGSKGDWWTTYASQHFRALRRSTHPHHAAMAMAMAPASTSPRRRCTAGACQMPP